MPSSTDPVAPIRREALQTILRVSVAAVALTLPFSFWGGWGLGYSLGLALLCAGLGALLLCLVRRPQAQGAVALGYFALSAAGCVGPFAGDLLFGESVRGGHPSGESMAGLFGATSWLPLLYLTALLVFAPRRALISSLLLYGVLLGVGAMYFAREGAFSLNRNAMATVFLQLYLSHAVLIGLYLMWGRLLRRSVLAAHAAQLEVRFAYEDALTNLPNRRQLARWLDENLGQGTCAVVLFDLDAFKRVNDTYGHDAGDEVLRQTASVVLQALPAGARFGRWGGEEFLVVLPNAEKRQAVAVAEQLRGAIATYSYPAGLRLTASFGVAVAAGGDDARLLLARADTAMYQAKHAGRDQVRLDGAPPARQDYALLGHD